MLQRLTVKICEGIDGSVLLGLLLSTMRLAGAAGAATMGAVAAHGAAFGAVDPILAAAARGACLCVSAVLLLWLAFAAAAGDRLYRTFSAAPRGLTLARMMRWTLWTTALPTAAAWTWPCWTAAFTENGVRAGLVLGAAAPLTILATWWEIRDSMTADVVAASPVFGVALRRRWSDASGNTVH